MGYHSVQRTYEAYIHWCTLDIMLHVFIWELHIVGVGIALTYSYPHTYCSYTTQYITTLTLDKSHLIPCNYYSSWLYVTPIQVHIVNDSHYHYVHFIHYY